MSRIEATSLFNQSSHAEQGRRVVGVGAVIVYVMGAVMSGPGWWLFTLGFGLLVWAAMRVMAVCDGERTQALERNRAIAAESIRQSQVMANLAHEIRNPLNGIMGMAQLLAQDDALSQDAREHTSMLLRASQSLLTILNDALDFAKMEAGRLELHREEFSVAALVKDTLAIFATAAMNKGVLLESVLEPNVAEWVRGDVNRIRQILSNFISNAIKFTTEGGITVRVAQAQTRDAAILCLSVTDTGSGMPEEVCAKLFSPFTQAEASTAARHGGTGLGLSISKGLAEMMGGEIGVESRVGEGSRFWFTVPASIVEVCAFEPRPVVESRGTTLAGMKILVAEDNAVNQRVVDRLLTKLGCSVEIAPDGAAAVAAVERSPFDLILMDYHMPKMSGPEAARAIRARPGAQRVPIIALTASADADDQQKCLDAGMDEILPKPFRPEQLLAVVERCRMPVGARLAGSRR